jgi:hypothetical protein
MPKEKKEKKSKVAETVEDVEMEEASPKVRLKPGGSDFSDAGGDWLSGGLSQKEKKVRKEKDEPVVVPEDLSPIAQPLAPKKLTKKLHKTIKRGVCSRKKRILGVILLMHHYRM